MDDKQNVTSDFSGAYHVMHSPGTSTDEILASIPVALGDPFEGREYTTVGQIGPVQPVGLNLSVVPVSATGQGDSDGEDNPLNAPPEINYGSVSQQVETLVDGWGRPLTNTAGIQARNVMKTVNDFELSVKRNFIAVNGPLANQYLNAVNSDTMTVLGDVWEPGQAGMVYYNARPVYVRRIVAYFEVDCRIQFRTPHPDTPKSMAWWHRYPSVGIKQRGGEVAFTGGGGTGAAGFAVVNSDKQITKIVVTCPGVGYTSAPSGTVTGGGGSGATFTTTLRAGSVDTATVTAPGSNYVAGLVDCVDKNKKPVSSPVPLDASGNQVDGGDEAFIVHRPERVWLLSYNALGLLDRSQ